MKKKLLFLTVAVTAMALSSCGGDKKQNAQQQFERSQEVYELPKEMITTKADTDEVKKLVDEYLDHLRHNDVDGAISMIHFLAKDSTITSLPKSMVKDQRRVLSAYADMDYKVDKMIFHKDVDCMVKYYALMPNVKGNNEVGFIIRPVRIAQKWYLTLANTPTDTVKSEIPN